MTSPSKRNDGTVSNVEKDITEDLDSFCTAHQDRMEVIAMACCENKVHKENFTVCIL